MDSQDFACVIESLKVIELFKEAVANYNLPVTLLLGLVLLYWLFVIFGFVDSDSTLEGGADVSDSFSSGLSSVLGGSGAWKKLGIGPLPLSVFGSIFAIVLWLFSLWGNYYFNGEPGYRSLGKSALLLLPNIILSYALTQIVLWPLRKFFAAMYQRNSTEEKLTGQVGIVISAQVDQHYGQVEISTLGAPILVNARVTSSAPALEKGTSVLILEQSQDGNFYFVQTPNTSTLSTPP